MPTDKLGQTAHEVSDRVHDTTATHHTSVEVRLSREFEEKDHVVVRKVVQLILVEAMAGP